MKWLLATSAACLFSGLIPRPADAQCSEGREIRAGLDDGFVLPVEPTRPSREYADHLEREWVQHVSRAFDEDTTDVALAHTFQGWLGPVCGATLKLGLRAGRSPLATNDSVRLEWIGAEDPQKAFRYWTTIRFVTGVWEHGMETVLSLDLANLPAYGGFPTDFLEDLSDGRLDLLVEDDTAVDFATLTVCPCSEVGTVDAATTTWGSLKAKY